MHHSGEDILLTAHDLHDGFIGIGIKLFCKFIAAAIYEYQADCDGGWGEISFDFENGTAEIIRLADWDTMITNRFANRAIAYLLNYENEKLPKEIMVAFEL